MSVLLYDRPINRLRDDDLEVNPLTGQLEPAVLLEYFACNQSNGSSEGGGLLTPSFATITTGAAVGPDGSMSAFRLTEDTNNLYHDVHVIPANAADGATVTISIYAKAGTRTRCWIGPQFGGSGLFGMFDLAAGEWIGSPPSQIVAINSGNGWWRFDTTYAWQSGGANAYTIGLLDATLNPVYQGDGSSYMLLFRYSNFANYNNGSSGILYLGSNTGAPIPAGFADTAPSQLAYGTGRAPDYPWQMPFEMTPQASSGFIEFIERGTIANPGQGLFQIGSYNATGPRLYIVATPSGYSIVHNNGSGQVSSTLSVAPVSGDLVRLRWSLNSDGSIQLWQSINGNAEIAAPASGAKTLAQSWAIPWIFVGGIGIVNVTGAIMALRGIVVLPGQSIPLATLLAAL